MKKNLLKVVFAMAFTLVAGYSVYSSSRTETNLPDFVLDNIEALASSETSSLGTLYGNSQGTRYCCCPGSRTCGASKCSGC